MRTAIGVGSYGCVYRPPHKCAVHKNAAWYKNKISKLMLDRHSLIELNEYDKIDKIDKKKQYFLGKPEICVPNKKEILTTVNPDNCDLFDNANIDEYRLLISKDGGMDLDEFFEKGGFDKYSAMFDSEQLAVNHFLLNFHNLFLAIKLFNENDIIHFDVKPSNIVFDVKTKSFKFIDFGLMDNISNVITSIKLGAMKTNIHWSYPLEHGFLRDDGFLSYANLHSQADVDRVIFFLQEIFSKSKSSSTIRTLGIPSSKKADIAKIKSKSSGFINTFMFMNNLLSPLTNSDKMAMISSTVNSIFAYKDRYDELLKKSINTMDTYALGFTLNTVANEIFKRGLLSRDHYTEIHLFCRQLFDFNVEARLENMDVILVKYEDVLQKIGVLDDLNVRFINHKIVKGSITSKTKSPTLVISTNKTVDKTLDISLQKNEIVVCPPGKEFNPVTQKCVKVCPPGKERGIKGRCVKVCSDDKERNSKGRCVSKKIRLIKNKTMRMPAKKHV